MLKLKLDKLVDERGWNPKKLSEVTGIRWNTVDDMIKNKSKHWSVENLEKIMKALGIDDVSEVFEYVKEK